MSVTLQSTVTTHTASGSTATFAYEFRILAAADLIVTANGETLTQGIDYSVSGAGAANGGSITLLGGAPAAGTVLRLRRSTRLVRSTDYQTAGDFLAAVVNPDFDRSIMALQDLAGGSSGPGNALRAPAGEALLELPEASQRAGMQLLFDADGAPYLAAPVSGSAADVMLQLAAAAGASKVGFSASGTGAQTRTLESKARERISVLDKIPESEHAAIRAGTSIYDCTAAFNAALADSRRVHVPAGTYCVANIGVVPGIDVEGEGTDRTHLVVTANNAGAFAHPGTNDILGTRLVGMTIRAGGGVTGARAWKQADCSCYTAFAYFDLETWADLEISFAGFFIYTKWTGRDGFNGTPPGAQKHTAITSIPAAWGQAKQTNLNRCERFFMFRSSNNAAVDIAYGVNWTFSKCGWENMSAPAIRARGIFGGEVRDSWCELMATPTVFVLDVSPAPNAQGSRPWTFRKVLADLASTSFRFVSIAGACSASVIDCPFINVPAGVLLTDGPTYLDEQYGNKVISGAGSAAFLAGARARRGSVEFVDDVVNTPVTANQNMLPIGPSGLGQANFSVSGITAKADVASAIGLAGQAVQFTLSGSGNVASYFLPAKLAEFLKGKTVTLVIAGYAGTATVSDAVAPTIWDSVLPNYGAGSIGSATINVGDSKLQIGYVTATVAGDSSALRVGFQVGGSNGGSTFIVESMALYLGEIKPQAMSFK